MITYARHVFIPIRLPGLNDMIDGAKGAGGTGAKYSRVKKKLTNDIALIIKAQHWPKMNRVHVAFDWVEPRPSRESRPLDPDNRAASMKFIFDAMKQAGVIPDDTLKEIAGFEHRFHTAGGFYTRVGVMVSVIDEEPG
jgi:Holliday junction resolvase RusA-like endonuclease